MDLAVVSYELTVVSGVPYGPTLTFQFHENLIIWAPWVRQLTP
jgi:hypothetical protein